MIVIKFVSIYLGYYDLYGIEVFTIETANKDRSLFHLSYNKFDSRLEIGILFMYFRIHL